MQTTRRYRDGRHSLLVIVGGWLVVGASRAQAATPILDYEFNSSGTIQTNGAGNLPLTTYSGGTPTNLVTGTPLGPSSHSNDLALNLGTNTGAGNIALSNSSGDYSALNTLKSFTMTAWLNDTVGTGSNEFIAELYGTNVGQSINFVLASQGAGLATTPGLEINGTKYSNSTKALPLSSNAWTFVAVSYDGNGNATFYNAGLSSISLQSASGTSLSTTGVNGSNTSFAIGATHTGSFPLIGAVDNVQLYNSVLSSDDLTRLFEVQATPEPFSLPIAAVGMYLMRRRRSRVQQSQTTSRRDAQCPEDPGPSPASCGPTHRSSIGSHELRPRS